MCDVCVCLCFPLNCSVMLCAERILCGEILPLLFIYMCLNAYRWTKRIRAYFVGYSVVQIHNQMHLQWRHSIQLDHRLEALEIERGLEETITTDENNPDKLHYYFTSTHYVWMDMANSKQCKEIESTGITGFARVLITTLALSSVLCFLVNIPFAC